MQAKITIKPIYRVTPKGFWLERRDYISPTALMQRLVEYQTSGGYALTVIKSSSAIASVVLISVDDKRFSGFLGELILACRNSFTLSIEVE